ncbi:hypothetical protein [Natrinema sp. 1APR25-10V2]|uniref:hypothetical protein n=1 Tax=Natrinema sp. 1APR25-10V2 TaxID=2951081 RepID=UPI00287B603B|nr:hypothetical protein [Natrinema sp. 1APR25-10V2]
MVGVACFILGIHSNGTSIKWVTKMDEPAVFGHVVDELESRGYQPLVHVPGAHEQTYADVLDRCESHQITIGGRYPDVLGFTNADRVFAVEVKGSSGLLRGIGQALTYQQGAHVSYLAAAEDVVTQHTDLLRSKGVGVIGAGESGVTRWSSPPTSESHEQVVDIEGQLSVRLRRSDISGDIASLSLAQPLNYLAPVVAIEQHGPLAGDELVDVLADEYEFGAGKSARQSALSLGLLQRDDRYTLTDQGELAATVLRGAGISTLQELDEVKGEVGRSTVVEEHQSLAILLQNCYERHPEFRLLLDALRKEGPSIHFPDLLRRLVHEYPNVFLNTFCTRASRTRARELIEAGQISRIYEEEAIWKDVIRTNVLFNFVQQLKHIGVLAAETRSHSGKISDYDPDSKPWLLREVR